MGNLTPSVMVAELQAQLHDITGARLLLWLNQEQDYIEKLRNNWKFCLDTDNTISVTSADDDYDLPSNFDHFEVVWNETDDKIMTGKTLRWLRKRDPDLSTTGSPDYYILLGPQGTNNVERVRFWRFPDADYTVGHDYYRKLPTLESTTDNLPSLIPSSELLMIGAEIRGRIDNEEAEDGPVIQGLRGRYARLLDALIKHNTHRPDRVRRIQPDARNNFDYWRYAI